MSEYINHNTQISKCESCGEAVLNCTSSPSICGNKYSPLYYGSINAGQVTNRNKSGNIKTKQVIRNNK